MKLKNVLKITFILFLAVSFSACNPPETIEHNNINIILNDGTTTGLNANEGFLAVFNPQSGQSPATFLIILPDSSSDITIDGQQNIIGSGKNLKLFLTNTDYTAGDTFRFGTFTLGQPSNGGVNYISYENGEAIESPSIVDGFAGTVTISSNSAGLAEITINASDPNNTLASIKGVFSTETKFFTY
mgnify:CR=1 FL=1